MEILECIAYRKRRLLSDYHDIKIVLEDELSFFEMNCFDAKTWEMAYNYIFLDNRSLEGLSASEIRDEIFARARHLESLL